MKKTKRGAMHLVRMLVFMVRRGRASAHRPSSIHAAPQGRPCWNNLAGAVRALHHNHLQDSPPKSLMAGQATPAVPFYELGSDTTTTTISTSGGMFWYEDTQDKIGGSEGWDGDGGSFNCDDVDDDDDDGPNAIDVRAEEFIAKFYQEMRLQRSDSIKRYNEMMERGTR